MWWDHFLGLTSSGNRHVLVICDYATRYLEAAPMKFVDAEKVATELVKVFARVGYQEKFSQIKGLISPVSFWQSSTGCCIFNQSELLHTILKQMAWLNTSIKHLKSCCACAYSGRPDQLLSYMLFAYREIPQSLSL